MTNARDLILPFYLGYSNFDQTEKERHFNRNIYISRSKALKDKTKMNWDKIKSQMETTQETIKQRYPQSGCIQRDEGVSRIAHASIEEKGRI